MTKQLTAVLGTGQTHHRAKRTDVSMPGLLREAIDRAMIDAQVGWADIDAVVLGKAPDLFEGVMMPELFLADALGANGKPLLRVHTAGSVGGSTALVAASLVQSGVHRRVLTVAFEKQSESNAMWGLSILPPFQMPVGVARAATSRRTSAPTSVAPARPSTSARSSRRRTAATARSTRSRTCVRRTSPSSRCRRRRCCGTRSVTTRPARLRTARARWCSATRPPGTPSKAAPPGSTRRRCAPSPPRSCGRDQVNPQAGRDAAAALWAEAGIKDPMSEVDVAEIYVPFSWFEPMWLENLGFAAEGEGWKVTEAGETAIGGRLPVNPSGGVLSSNPIGASGMLRFSEAAKQVMGRAGDYQVDGARVALGHAYGGGSQYFSMWVVGAAKPR